MPDPAAYVSDNAARFGRKGHDQAWLKEHVWPLVADDCLQHDHWRQNNMPAVCDPDVLFIGGYAREELKARKHYIQQELLDEPRNSDDAMVSVRRKEVPGVNGEMWAVELHKPVKLVGACPDCGSQLEYAEGCAKCHVCGFSECG